MGTSLGTRLLRPHYHSFIQELGYPVLTLVGPTTQANGTVRASTYQQTESRDKALLSTRINTV